MGKRAQSFAARVCTLVSTSGSPASPARATDSTISTMSVPISLNSARPNPRVVPAGVPSLIPDVMAGFSVSNGIAFLLQVI
jgi:hypothetical protein